MVWLHTTPDSRIFGILKILVIHILYIHIKNQFCNTNMQERLNGTLDDRCHMARVLNSGNSPTYRIFILHYNYIRPHTGLDGKTPVEAANVQIQGTNKWVTLIQQAAMAQQYITFRPLTMIRQYFAQDTRPKLYRMHHIATGLCQKHM